MTLERIANRVFAFMFLAATDDLKRYYFDGWMRLEEMIDFLNETRSEIARLG